MNQSTNKSELALLDDVAIDRLVDGELAAEERLSIIAALETHPDGWRRCALAFLESQSLREQLGAIAVDLGDGPESPASSSRSSRQAVELANVAPPSETRSPAYRVLNWLAVAACLLVAFGIGWQTSLRSLTPAEEGSLVAQDDQPVAEQPQQTAPAPAAELDARDALTLVVRDASGAPQRLRVPLVEADQMGGAVTEAWQPLRQQLRDSGLDLKVRRRYAPLFIENPQGLAPMIVPVDDATVTPVSREVF